VALIFADGFDHYASGDILKKWSVGSGTIGSSYKRNGANGLHNPGAPLGKTLLTASGPTCIIGFAIRWSSFAGSQSVVACSDSNFSGNPQVVLCGNADGTLTARVGGVGGTVLGTTSWVAIVNTWYYLEIKVVINATTGSVQVRINGTSVLNVVNANTKFTANLTWNGIYLSVTGADYDDIYVCDGTGTVNNDFLGDTRVETILPQADSVAPGTNHGLTCSTGSDHGALVNEATPNDDTDYNSSATVGVKDTYRFAAMVNTGGIQGIQVLLDARKSDHALKQLAPVLRTNGIDYAGSTVDAPPSYVYATQLYQTNPNTNVPWTSLDVNKVETGLQVIT
jgi:hypothetical protein